MVDTTHDSQQDAEQDTWDVIVLGAGPAGENAADYAIRGSSRTAVMVESELVGGECSYWACMPSKALLRPIEVLDTARQLKGLAGPMKGRDLDVEGVLERRDVFTSRLDDSGQEKWATGAGIDVLRGTGRLVGPRAVEVKTTDGPTRTVRAREAVVLATGTTASIPPVPGLAEALPWTSRDVTNLHQVPRRVAILGGGVVACEAATWLIGLGVEELTIIDIGDRLLPRSEPFAGDIILASLRSRGATVLTGRKVQGVVRESAEDNGTGHISGGPVTLELDEGTTIVADELVVATGRTPRSDDIGLETLGIADAVEAAHGYVAVNDHLQVEGVSDGWLYAVGDLTGRALLTHMGKYQARIAGAVIGARAEARSLEGKEFRDVASERVVPSVTFTSPEVSSVGLTESAARDAGIDVETVEYDVAGVAGASLLRDDYTGRAKLVIDRAQDTLVGATFVGAGTAELVHSATVAIIGGVTLADLWHAVPSYPTVSEVWLRLLESRRS
jgi:dihydrolipoamide dehydrogenase